jgi:hypothetical protein
MTKAQILKAAKGLKLDDRMDLVDGLLASVTAEEQAEIDRAWGELALSRLRAIERGEVEPVPGEAAIEAISAKYRR